MNTVDGLDVLGLGVTAVDDLLYVDGWPEPDSKTPLLRRERQCGGLAATALVAASRLGARCAYAGVLGDDELSRYVLGRLNEERVLTDSVVVRSEARPIHSTIVVDVSNNTRTILFDRRAFASPDEALPSDALIASSRTLLVDHYGVVGTIRAARIARDSGVAVVGDIEGRTTDRFEELLGLVDHLIVSAGVAKDITGESDPWRAAEALWDDSREIACVTVGSEGSWVVDQTSGGSARHHVAYAVEVVDTTGCGDVFHGAYAAAVARGDDVRDRISFASAAAALKATRRGGQAGIPTRAAVEAFLSERGE